MGEGFFLGFEKQAAPKWIKMFRKGNLSFEGLSEAAKKLKANPRSIDKLPIAKGSEAVVSRVTHPEHGIAVQKAFDLRSPLVGDKTIQQRINIMEALKDHPAMAKPLGKHRNKNLPVMYQEYVKGPTATNKYMKGHPDIKSLQRTARKKGVGSLHDLNPSNIIMSGKGPKVVDFMPTRPEMGSPVSARTERSNKGDFIGALRRAFEK